MSKAGGDPTIDLFASLKAYSSRNSPTPDASLPFNFQTPSPSPGPTLKSPSTIPSAYNMSQPNTPASQGPPNLLGLLKFGQPSASPSVEHAHATPTKPNPNTSASPSVHARGISASDLVSGIMGNKPSQQVNRDRAPTPSSSHQDSLLKLLNKTAGGSESPHHSNDMSSPSPLSHGQKKVSVDQMQTERQQSPMRFFGTEENKPPSPFQPQYTPEGSPSLRNGSAAHLKLLEGKSALGPSQVPRKTSANGGTPKRVKSQSPSTLSASSRRKITPNGDDILQSIENVGAGSAKNGRTPVEALMGIGAPSRDAETVAQALNEVGSQVDRQVENALAKAEDKEWLVHIKQENEDSETAKFNAIEEHVHDAAVGLKEELDKNENKNILSDVMPTAAAEAVKEIIDEAAGDQDDSNDNQLVRQVKVYQFPMRPFVSIDIIRKELTDVTLREGSATPIARFKKEFDQSDRTLATATNDFIAYAIPKSTGGIRVIEQDNGSSSLLFGESQDRVFNIAISAGPTSNPQGNALQTVIATGISGAVYWATIAEPDVSLSQVEMQQSSVIFPPTSGGVDFTSGGQLKTRAKKSSRTPGLFAIGRGKAIQVVFPAHARNSKFFNSSDSTLDTEGYFLNRNLKITTGKAGKDFTFSEDDTTIVTLDKAGKMRIWDIRELTDPANANASRLAPIEVKSPILTYATAHAAEKSWPTSVLFVDKARPYTKGSALRYIIVGMKQNHTLQLWDLCLGKAVQELNFPHEKETDGICSVTYHANSGIIAVGHPTRNSVFFVHLSAPKYNLPSMSQAKFAQRLLNRDASLPKAEATAIMSGMREYSLSDKGELRSIELTSSSVEASRSTGDDNSPLFDLYVMHSKGVHCLSINKEDLGWSPDNRVQRPVDAEGAGVIVVKDLKDSSSLTSSDPSTLSTTGDDHISTLGNKTPAKTSNSENVKLERSDPAPQSSRDADQKKGKKGGPTETSSKPTPSAATQDTPAKAMKSPAVSVLQPTANSSKESMRPSLTKHASREAPEPVSASVQDRAKIPIANGDSVSLGISGEFLDKELKKIEQGVSNEFNKVLRRELDSLYKQFAEDKRVQDASGVAKQDAMLRLVSSTLSENVEKSLSRIINKSIQDSVIPSLAELTSSAVTKHLKATISEQVKSTVPPAMKHAMDDALKRSLQSPEILRAISEQVSKPVAAHLDRDLSSMMKTVTPSFQTAASNVAQKIIGDSERRFRDQVMQVDAQRQSDSIKIDQLTALVTGMSGMLNTMAEAQTVFQSKILELQQQMSERTMPVSRRRDSGNSLTPSESASYHVSPEQEELRAVTDMWNSGNHEEATVMWLQSQQQVALFDDFFVHQNPNYVRQSSPLVILSIGAAVTSTMETNAHERLIWLAAVMTAIDPKAAESREVGGRILEVLTQRLEQEYMRIGERDPQNSNLRTIATLTKQSRELRRLFP